MKNIFENNSYQYTAPHCSLLPQKVAKSAKSANLFFDSFPPFLLNEFDGFDGQDSSGKVSMGKHHRMAPAIPSLGSAAGWNGWKGPSHTMPINALFPGVALGGVPWKIICSHDVYSSSYWIFNLRSSWYLFVIVPSCTDNWGSSCYSTGLKLL